MPRWTCGSWSQFHGWVHICSDLAIFGSYTAIPLMLLYFIFRKNTGSFAPVFALFAVFILACGFGHLIEATMFWYPWYRFSGAVKAVTAIVSVITVIALVRYLPIFLLLRTPEELQREITQRKLAEADADKSLHFVSQLVKHQADLAVEPLLEHEPEQAGAQHFDRFAFRAACADVKTA